MLIRCLEWIQVLTTFNMIWYVMWSSKISRNYTLIAFDERVTFWLQLVGSLPCGCAYVALFARRVVYNHYAIAHSCNAANAHAQGSDRAVEVKKLLSRWRQSEYRANNDFEIQPSERKISFALCCSAKP